MIGGGIPNTRGFRQRFGAAGRHRPTIPYGSHQRPETPVKDDMTTRATVEELLRRIGEGDPDKIAELYAEQVDW
ncbi:hypothetical protein ACQPYK_24595 [Streptosporangium sp. CA-135522]|uniref:hypothetical protein n=1 Tax=Streptosporangium sp. CA-135522 TaxID=3240072 RepID=UPI003D925508